MKECTGTNNRVLIVDLSDGSSKLANIPPDWRRDYLGGKGMALRWFYELASEKLPALDPLGPENLLCFFTGVVSGTGAVCSARFSGLCLSPLTGLMVHASCGGPFGIALKTSGYDGLILRGQADQPVVLYLDDPESEAPLTVKPAEDLWGLDCRKVQDVLQLEKRSGAAVIGPAGENLVPYANIASGHRYLGRGGMGAVMGSKRVKAVVARGGLYRFAAQNPQRFSEVKKRSTKYIKRNSFSQTYKKYGTASNLRPGNKAGFVPVLNFRKRIDFGADELSGEAMAERYQTKPSTCRPCSIICGHKGTYPDGSQRQIPEYETAGLLGPNIGNHDPDILGRWNDCANRMGLDTVSLGATLSWAMEAAEKGIRPSSLRFGEHDEIEGMIEKIARREGEGDELARGSRWLSQRYGGKDFAIQVKGMELAAYDPRAAWGQGLNYAVANRGGCHLNAYPVALEVLFGFLPPYSSRSKARWVDYFENVYSAVNSLHTCQFTGFAYVLEPFVAKRTPRPLLKLAMTYLPRLSRLGLDWGIYAGLFESITGIPLSRGRFIRCGQRVHVLERYINTMRGVDIESDTLPERFLSEGKTDHPIESTVPLMGMRRAYYRAKGYDRRGIPRNRLLERLAIPLPSGSEKQLRPSSRPFARGYAAFILFFLGRAAAAASRIDPNAREEFSRLPKGFRFALKVGSSGPAMVIEHRGQGRAVYLGGSDWLAGRSVDLVLRIKHLSAALLLFTFREATAVSQARDRLIAEGPIPETCTVVRILNRTELLVLPRAIARRAVKRYERPRGVLAKRCRIYAMALLGRKGV